MGLRQFLAQGAAQQCAKIKPSGIEASAGWVVNVINRLKPRLQLQQDPLPERNVMLRALGTALALIGLLLAVLPTHAENLGPGGGTRIITGDEVVGPYRLLITTAPEPAQVGTLTIVVRVNDASSGQRVDDASIQVELTDSASGTRLTQMATHANAGNAIDYAAHFTIEQAGTWNGLVRITGAAGTAEVSFLQRIQAQRKVGVLIAAGIPFIVILGLLAGAWFLRSGSRQRAPK